MGKNKVYKGSDDPRLVKARAEAKADRFLLTRLAGAVRGGAVQPQTRKANPGSTAFRAIVAASKANGWQPISTPDEE